MQNIWFSSPKTPFEKPNTIFREEFLILYKGLIKSSMNGSLRIWSNPYIKSKLRSKKSSADFFGKKFQLKIIFKHIFRPHRSIQNFPRNPKIALKKWSGVAKYDFSTNSIFFRNLSSPLSIWDTPPGDMLWRGHRFDSRQELHQGIEC